jgi:isoleucyl-tRNA synthetase
VAKLTAPFAPFLAEELYRNLNTVTCKEQAESVHLATIPEIEETAIDAGLESRMEEAQQIVELVRAMRMKSNLKVRQPLKRIILPVANENERRAIEQMKDIILEEINVKTMEFVADDSGVVKKKAKANFKSIGPKFGKAVKHVAERIKDMSAVEIAELERAGDLQLQVNGSSFHIGPEDVEIIREDIHGWLVESSGGLTVALDIELTDELVAEGFAREFVNRVQNMRKDAGFDVTDRIVIGYRSTGKLSAAVKRMSAYIKAETLAVELTDNFRAGEYSSTQDINGESAEVSIARRN